MDQMEYTTEQDLFYDFCLWEYQPAASRTNKFRSVNLLYNSFNIAGMPAGIFELVQTIRRGFGFFNTVWGVKHIEGELRWEYYFYDYRRRERERSITKLLGIIRPFIRCEIKVNENFHYFMFSIDITGDLLSGRRDLDEIHMYIGNPGSTVSSGICYSLTSMGTRLENFYFFFDAEKQNDDILDKAFCSAYIDNSVNVDQVFWPEMRNCKIIVVANKQGNDAIYFSGIDVDQLIYFLKRMEYPPGITSFVEENREKLDHMHYDAGFDYRMEKGDMVILKSGYYGIF